MDITERKITKIAREAEKLVLLTMREEGVGTAEIDLIHAVRHHPGCTQAQLAELLHADKAVSYTHLDRDHEMLYILINEIYNIRAGSPNQEERWIP